MKTTFIHALSLSLAFVHVALGQVPPAGTPSNPPAGFAVRTVTAPQYGMVKLAQDPVTKDLYAIGRENGFGATRLYRVNISSNPITFTQLNSANGIVSNVQGMTFDRFGNIYIAGQIDKIVKGTPNGNEFSFSDFLVFNNPGSEHGLGGLVTGPDDKLYFSNGAQTSNGPAMSTIRFGVNVEAKILRMNINGSGNLEVFAHGSRNHFGMAFRSDGKLFGVENGPKGNCQSGGRDYGEEFNLIEQGVHLGFPYYYGSDLSGSDNSLPCNNPTIPSPPAGTYTPAWRNNGPNGKPGSYAQFYSFNPHSCAEGISFYDPANMDPSPSVKKFPAAFHGRAFVARFGQLTGGISDTGFDVLSLDLDDTTQSFTCNTFLTGLARAIDVLCAYNGKLYILTFDATTGGTGLGGNGRLHEVSYTLDPPVEGVDFTANVTTGSAPLTVQFTDQSNISGASAWLWNFGDGQTSPLQNPSHQFTAEGAYTVRLTVTGTSGDEFEEKVSYIKVADLPKIAFISGQIPPPASDTATIAYLESLGLDVTAFDDEPSNRPTAAQIAAAHDVVVGSSIILSGNVAGEFRHQTTPFIFWESSLAIADRESLADGAGTDAGSTQVNVINNTHPIMAGVPLGVVTLASSPSDFSRSTGPIAPGVQVLATHATDAGNRAIMAAEPGALLLDGGVAAGKRACLYLYDSTWLNTNTTGKQILVNAVLWGLGAIEADFDASVVSGSAPLAVNFTDTSTGPVNSWSWNFGDSTSSTLRHPSHTYTQPGTYDVTLTADGLGSPDTLVRTAYIVVGSSTQADLDQDGDVDEDDFLLFSACLSGPGIPLVSGCGQADLDTDGDTDVGDYGKFQRCYSGQNIPAILGCDLD